MLKPAFLVPVLALTGVLTLSASAEAAGNGMMALGRGSSSTYAAQSDKTQVHVAAPHITSPAASSFTGNETPVTKRNFFTGRKTTLYVAPDGTKRTIITTRRFFGGTKQRIIDRRGGQALFDSAETLTRGGNIKKSVSAGEGGASNEKTRLNPLTWNRTTHFADQNEDGTMGREGKITMSGNQVKKQDKVEWDHGYKTHTVEHRNFFTRRLTRTTVTTDPDGNVVGQTHEKIRRNGTLVKGTAVDGTGTFTRQEDRKGRVKNEKFEKHEQQEQLEGLSATL